MLGTLKKKKKTARNSKFPVAKLPLPVGSEVSSGFGRGSSISELSLRSHTSLKYPSMHTGMSAGSQHSTGGNERRSWLKLFITGSLRRTNMPRADQSRHWYLREPLMEIHIWTSGLRTRGRKPDQHEGSHSEPRSDKVTEVCSKVGRRRWRSGFAASSASHTAV